MQSKIKQRFFILIWISGLIYCSIVNDRSCTNKPCDPEPAWRSNHFAHNSAPLENCIWRNTGRRVAEVKRKGAVASGAKKYILTSRNIRTNI